METSISKAIVIVAGLLLAMLVIAFVSFSFIKIGSWATTSDDETLIKQKEEFNREFEAYDKDLMYGVDIISCLNKAKSINDQVQDSTKINGDKYDETYQITVSFKINTPLTESVWVYHMNAMGKEVEYTDTDKNSLVLKKNEKLNTVFKISLKYSSSGISKLNYPNQSLTVIQGNRTNIAAGTYILSLTGSDKTAENLMTLSNEVKQVVKNSDSNSSNINSWTKAVWETPLYDLKTRKFKCTKMEYNAKTGRINNIVFEEF